MIKKTTNNKRNIIIAIIMTIVIIAIISFFALKNEDSNDNDNKITTNANNTKTTNSKSVDSSNKFLSILKTDIILGDKNAPVKLIEYASMSCPHCAEFYANGFENLKDYIDSGEVVFIYRDLPLNGPALAGAVAAQCYYNRIKMLKIAISITNEKYYNFVKNLYKHQEKWAFMPNFIDKLKEISAMQGGISDEELTKCFENKELQKSIIANAQEASQSLEIKATPTFIINDQIISGYKGWDVLAKAIDEKLNEK
jgi:protein-disulfide isomerase